MASRRVASWITASRDATRRDPDRARRHGDSLEDAPAGEREDDDVAPADMFGDQRERGPLEHDAATGSGPRAPASSTPLLEGSRVAPRRMRSGDPRSGSQHRRGWG